MGNIFGNKVLPEQSESVDSTTVQPPSAYAYENREKDGRKKKRSKKRSLKKKRT